MGKKKSSGKKRKLSGAALVAAARARGLRVGGRRRRGGGGRGGFLRSVSGGARVEALVPPLAAGAVGGVMLGRLLPLPSWLSPIGAAVWLYGYWKNNAMLRLFGLLMIAFGILDKMGITGKIGNLLGKVLPTAASVPQVAQTFQQAAATGQPQSAPTTAAPTPQQAAASGGPMAGYGALLTGAGAGIADVVNAFNQSSAA